MKYFLGLQRLFFAQLMNKQSFSLTWIVFYLNKKKKDKILKKKIIRLILF
jgi:hypothetical protein